MVNHFLNKLNYLPLVRPENRKQSIFLSILCQVQFLKPWILMPLSGSNLNLLNIIYFVLDFWLMIS